MEDVTVGILGLGRGFAHLRNFLATDGARVIGACDWYESRHDCANTHLASVGKKAELMRNYDDLLALQPDAIVVASHGKPMAWRFDGRLLIMLDGKLAAGFLGRFWTTLRMAAIK